MAAGDVLVTDHSSVGFEYLLFDRPVVRIDLPDLIAKTDIEPSYVALLASASTSVVRSDQAVAAVQRALDDPGRLSQEQRAVAGEMFHRPGTATDRAECFMYEVIELDPPKGQPPGRYSASARRCHLGGGPRLSSRGGPPLIAGFCCPPEYRSGRFRD